MRQLSVVVVVNKNYANEITIQKSVTIVLVSLRVHDLQRLLQWARIIRASDGDSNSMCALCVVYALFASNLLVKTAMFSFRACDAAMPIAAMWKRAYSR